MSHKKILLKLGGRKHLGEERWRDALNLFDEIYSFCSYAEPSHAWEIPSDKVHCEVLPKTTLNHFFFRVVNKFKSKKRLSWIITFLLSVLRILNCGYIKKVKSVDVAAVLCSYGDYDNSDFMFCLCKNVIDKPVVRAYKETRPEYNYLEYTAMKSVDKIVLFDVKLKEFLEKKYGSDFFAHKKVIVGYDENALPSCILDGVHYQEKLSTADGKVHLVILSFRVDSAPNRSRDQGRYYYIDIIKEIISAGVVVHLHCSKYNDDKGVNRYKELQAENPGMFYMEEALAMKYSSSTEEWINSCDILSRYDAGLLHNIVDESSVSEFDGINIPHRFFTYEAAHVTPILKRGENIVLGRMFEEKRCGFMYNTFSDLPGILNADIEYYTPSYEDYLKAIFEL
ncbi:MAG: hypothetical protein LUK37_22155 [Clostridia bacterium]|nr:hypothetical protein [Clostridia bacterium]